MQFYSINHTFLFVHLCKALTLRDFTFWRFYRSIVFHSTYVVEISHREKDLETLKKESSKTIDCNYRQVKRIRLHCMQTSKIMYSTQQEPKHDGKTKAEIIILFSLQQAIGNGPVSLELSLAMRSLLQLIFLKKYRDYHYH